MKILYITYYSDLYGANRSLLNQIDSLLKLQNYEIIVICSSEGDFINEIKKRNIVYIVIPFKLEISRNNLFLGFIRGVYCCFYNFLLIIKYYKTLEKEKIDIIHSNTSIIFYGAYLSKLLNIPHIWHIRELMEHYSFHYSFGNKYFMYWLKKAKKVICISNYVYQIRIKKVNSNNALILYNGIISRKTLVNNYIKFIKKNESTFNFIYVGLLSKSKNPMTALVAFKNFLEKHPSTHLYIVGSGSEKEKLYSFVNSYNIQNKVTFTGYIKNVADFYLNSKVLLMCSDKEALGRVTVEAMSYGLVVIGYNSGGTSEIVQDHVNGLLYDGDASDLTKKMELIYSKKDLYDTLSQNAMKSVEKFTIEDYISNLEKIYLSTL